MTKTRVDLPTHVRTLLTSFTMCSFCDLLVEKLFEHPVLAGRSCWKEIATITCKPFNVVFYVGFC